jgi:hypothetical protein
MEFEYKILIGETPYHRTKSEASLFSERVKDLEKKVNATLLYGGECVGGLVIKHNNPYQAVKVPKSSSESEPTNPFTTAVRSGASRKSKKSKKSRKL